MKNSKIECKLCRNLFDYEEMSEEHYPAKSVGNDDVVSVNLLKLLDKLEEIPNNKDLFNQLLDYESRKNWVDKTIDEEVSTSLYPNGRTTRSLCRNCNSFLGKYDESYLKFFSNDGEYNLIKGFTNITKLKIIKSIFGKFLSVPEAKHEEFDFINFIRDVNAEEYNGKWNLYFIRRDSASDIFGLSSIDTGKLELDEGVVYEFSDEKFIFNLLNFEKPKMYEMNNIFDILSPNYKLIEGVGKNGGYHKQILEANMCELFVDFDEE